MSDDEFPEAYDQVRATLGLGPWNPFGQPLDE